MDRGRRQRAGLIVGKNTFEYMPRINRRADWFLITAIVIFLGGVLVNYSIWVFVERPLIQQLRIGYEEEGKTNPGAYFMPASATNLFRCAVSLASLGVGFLFALAGSFRIPRKLKTSRILREACWGGFAIGFLAMLLLY